MSESAPTRSGPGRPLDRDRDAVLLNATIELLRDHGYDGFTVADVAARAHAGKATVYRRWQSKADLVTAAFSAAAAETTDPPDTGSLRGDLLALTEVMATGIDRLGQVVTVIKTQLQHDPEFIEAFHKRFLSVRLAVVGEVFARAQRRGEISSDVDTEMLCELIPAVMLYHVIVLDERPDPVRIRRLVEAVLLPAALAGSAGRNSTRGRRA